MRLAERALHAAGVLLYLLRLHRLVMWATRRWPKVVLYHAVAPEESDDLREIDANVPPAAFAAQLDFFARYYTVVSMQRLSEAHVPARALAITFDDGYRSVLEHAAPALAARGLPATVYAVPAVIGNERLIWVNELNWLARRHPPEARAAFAAAFDLAPDARLSPRAMIDHARAHFDPSRVERCLTAIHRGIGSDRVAFARARRLYLDWDEVERLAGAGLTVGNHTWSHPSLPCLPVPAQIEEIARGMAALAHLRHSVPSFAFPFGDASEPARAAATAGGHRTICDVGGVNRPGEPHRIARVPLHPHAAPAAIFAELEVVATLKGLVKSWLARRRRAARTPRPTGLH